MARKEYCCADCGRELIVDEAVGSPDCCGKPMRAVPLETCTKAHDAEQARWQDADDACDDSIT